MVAPFLPDEEKLAAIREALPASAAGIYLDTPTCGPLPSETARAMTEIRDWELRTGRGGAATRAEMAIRHEEARAAAAAIVTSDPDDVRLTHGAADGIERSIEAIGLEAGDRILASTLCSPTAIALAAAMARRERARLELVDDTGSLDGPARVVLVPHVSPQTGALLPIGSIATAATAAGTGVVVDGTQAAGAIPVDVEALGVDAYVIASETWLLGPQGVGALWLRRGSRSERLAAIEPSPGPDGTGHDLGSVVGFARSCGWLSMAVGLGWIHERTRAMAALAHDLLAAVAGVAVMTPRDHLAGIVAFRIAGWGAEQALEELGRRAFAIASTVPELDAVRIGAACFNTQAELERLRAAVDELAAHSPETLPRPRQLTILGDPG